MGKWVIAKYIRLSQADRDLGRDDRKQESNSISHQRDMLETYIAGHPELAECDQMEFLDDGFSGAGFERPGFEMLLDKIRRQEVTCVIVKDFSRFGRDYIELGDYLERIFPLLGVRFISVNDHYDSLDYKGTTGGLDVVMKNIVYAYYSKDLSVKVKTAKRAKMKRGEHRGGQAPYGYDPDPAKPGGLIVDPVAARVVREIYDAFLSGKQMYEIVDILNQRGEDPPSKYYGKKHPEFRGRRNYSEMTLWNSRTVRSILRGKVYYGAYVAHRMERVEVGKDRTVQVPEEEQIVIEGMHEPIVTKEEYLEVQKRMTKTHRKPAGPLHYPLRGKVKCGTCGRSCRRMTKNPWKNPHQVYLCQFSKRQKGSVALEGRSCSGDDIDEKALEEIVWNAIRKMIALSDEAKRRIAEGLKKVERDQAALEKELIKAKKDKERAEAEKVQLTERFLMEELSVEAYQRERLKPDLKLSQAERKMGEIQQKLDELKTCQSKEALQDVEKLQVYAGAKELTEEIVGALVEKVLFYEKGHVEIEWRFSEEFLKMVGKEDD